MGTLIAGRHFAAGRTAYSEARQGSLTIITRHCIIFKRGPDTLEGLLSSWSLVLMGIMVTWIEMLGWGNQLGHGLTNILTLYTSLISDCQYKHL